MSEQIFRINDFGGGFFDSEDVDLLDIPDNALQSVQNMRPVPGGLRSRNSSSNLLTSNLTALESFGEFRGLEGNTLRRFLLAKDGTSIKRFVYSGGYSAASSDTDDYGGSIAVNDIAYYNVINNNFYISFFGGWGDFQATTMWYGYINRSYFNDTYSVSDWVMDEAHILTPSTSYLALSQKGTATAPILDGKYFFRTTWEFDGYQEGWWQESGGGSQETQTASNTDGIELLFGITNAQMPKRATAINIYCAYAEDTSAGAPDTGYYHIGRVEVNDSNWSGAGTHQLTVSLVNKTSVNLNSNGGSFPADYETTGFDDALYNIEEELFTRNNALSSTKGFDVDAYGDNIWLNGRRFLIRPATQWSMTEFPFDKRQVVLFSQVNKPDVIHFYDDFIDVSTKEGDYTTALTDLFGDLVVLKENHLFRINLNDSNNILNWTINDPLPVGCIAPKSVAKGKDIIFFAGSDNIYAYNGSQAVPITLDGIRETYQTYLSQTYSTDSDYDNIFGVYDSILDRYILNFPSVTGDNKYLYYDIRRRAWYRGEWDNASYAPGFITLGIDKTILGSNATKIFNLEDSTDSAETFTGSFKSKWFDLNGNPYQQKRIKWLKVIFSHSGDDPSFKIYTNYSGTASKTYTMPSQDFSVYYTEVSLIGKIFAFEASSTACGNSDKFIIHDYQVGYEVLDER